jgi:hypothetical protein
MTDLNDLRDRYVAVWNEPDPAARRKQIEALWAPDGGQVLVHPPEDVRDAAERLRFPVPALEVRGHDALEARVGRAHEMFVDPGEFVFRAPGDAEALLGDDVVAVRWEMVPVAGGPPAGAGVDVLDLDRDGRIRTDHQYIGLPISRR